MNDASRQLAEEARQTETRVTGFAASLFMGQFLSEKILPYPEQDAQDRRAGDDFVATLGKFLKEKVDADAIDRSREIPAEVMKGLAEIGCFGIKIPKEYGGLGLSQVNYDRAMALVASHCGSTAVMLSVHQSVGVPQPLVVFGTPAQKLQYLPRLARGALSAFALTEPEVGSDPGHMSTTATPVGGGKAYLLNGRKLWITNGPVAELMVVLAVIPDGSQKKRVTAFIVETAWPGFEVIKRCDFMGLKGMQNGLIAFKDVRVPAENMLAGPGQGLKLALTAVDIGRLTLPAAWTGVAKRCLKISREWAGKREQWGQVIGKHEAVAAHLASMASATFAMESATWLASSLASEGDIRVEAAMAKLYGSKICWDVINQAVQIRGGRGFETADSQKARGEESAPLERLLRDARANTIVEGTTEVLRLFLAREAVEPHWKRLGSFLQAGSFKSKIGVLLKQAPFYIPWYLGLWFGWMKPKRYDVQPTLAAHLKFVRSCSRRLARTLFHHMVVHGASLEKMQRSLGRLTDIGTLCFAMAATCAKADSLYRAHSDPAPVDLADFYCRLARRQISGRFRALDSNEDTCARAMSEMMLEGKFKWLEEGIL